jgi:bacterioferritin-associated ferredoxin
MVVTANLSYLGLVLQISSVFAATNTYSVPGTKSAFVAPSGFPASVFSSYYEKASPTQEPQPKLYDYVLDETYPLDLTDPKTIPTEDTDPVYFPEPIAKLSTAQQKTVIAEAVQSISEIIEGSYITTNCSKCIASMGQVQAAAKLAPKYIPELMIEVCQKYQFHSNATCVSDFNSSTFGSIWTQIVTFGDMEGLDGQYVCNSLSTTFCKAPYTHPINITSFFPKPKPANCEAPKASGKRVKVLHM